MSLHDKAIVVASGHLLIDYLPTFYTTMSDEELHAWLEENAWQPFENKTGGYIWQEIESLADTLIQFHEENK